MKTDAKYSCRDSTRFIPLFSSLWKKNLTLPFPSWMCQLKKVPLNLSLLFTVNPPLPANVYAGIPSVHKNAKNFLWPNSSLLATQKLPVANKDVLLALQNSNVIYQIHATAIVGMWAALPKDYKTESNNMFRNLSVMALLPQNVIFQFANSNIPPSQQLKFNLSRMIRPLDFTFYAIPLALNTMMTACSPFSQKDVCHFIFQLLKPPSLKLPTLFSANKKNSFIT